MLCVRPQCGAGPALDSLRSLSGIRLGLVPQVKVMVSQGSVRAEAVRHEQRHHVTVPRALQAAVLVFVRRSRGDEGSCGAGGRAHGLGAGGRTHGLGTVVGHVQLQLWLLGPDRSQAAVLRFIKPQSAAEPGCVF